MDINSNNVNNGMNINKDELQTSVQSMVRGTDLNGNYTFEGYEPKSPVSVSDSSYRVAKVMYKTNKKTGKIAGENSCLIVPHITGEDVTSHLEALTKHVVNMLESEQDKIIKGYHLDKVSFVTPETISIDAIIESLEAVATSGRMNKELIVAWFTENLADDLIILFADKLGCEVERMEDETSKLFLTIEVYKNLFSKMASNTTFYQPHEATKLMQAIDVCEADSNDSITVKLKEKLGKMINPVNTMELLGF